jgi:tRNA nucleotidyltransferase (CCA-adding enzyme)
VARRASVYPQVMPTAADLIDGPIVSVPATLAAKDAMRVARRRGADVLRAGAAAWILREDAARADALGLGDVPVRRLARPLPVVAARESEIVVRRHLLAGASVVVVVRGRAPLGVVRRATPPPPVSMQARFERWLDAETRTLLGVVGRLAADLGARAYAVGGLVRDAWLDRPVGGHDLDVVVEGDAGAVARALADAVAGKLVEHERFLTASVELPSGRRIDVVTARSERYEQPGALPRVLPAAIGADLVRRDFGVNAMAVELASGAFELLDVLGGAEDIARRRLRVLHPLSFVEDPTRIFRAARYAARLGFDLDGWSARCRRLALELGPYPALSPARLATELERILAEPTAGPALTALARAGAFRLLDPRHRITRATAAWLAALPVTLQWARRRRVVAPPLEVLATALAAEQPPAVAAATLSGLALSGAPLARVHQALAAAPTLRAQLAAATRPSVAARALRAAGALTPAWTHLVADEAGRERLDDVMRANAESRIALGGEALLRLGVTQGPDVASVLAGLRDARLDGEIRDRASEIEYVRTWLSNRTTGRRGPTPPADPPEEG